MLGEQTELTEYFSNSDFFPTGTFSVIVPELYKVAIRLLNNTESEDTLNSFINTAGATSCFYMSLCSSITS